GEHDRNHQPDAQRDGQALARTPVLFATRPQHEVRTRALRLQLALDDPLVAQAIEFLLMLEGFVLEQEELLVLLADPLHQVATARMDSVRRRARAMCPGHSPCAESPSQNRSAAPAWSSSSSAWHAFSST